MTAPRGKGGPLPIAIGVAAVVIGVVVFAATRIQMPKRPVPAPAANSGAPAVNVVRLDPNQDSAWQQQAALYDPSPLFLPTAVNTSDPPLPTTMRRDPGGGFQGFGAKYTFAEYDMRVAFPDPIAVPASPTDGLTTGNGRNPFFTMGRVNFDYKPLPARAAQIEIVQAKTGRIVLSAPLTLRDGERLPLGEWRPIELMAAVDAAGLVGDPTITSGSGSEEIDTFFRNLIAKQFRLGERLPPGFYTLRVGP